MKPIIIALVFNFLLMFSDTVILSSDDKEEAARRKKMPEGSFSATNLKKEKTGP